MWLEWEVGSRAWGLIGPDEDLRNTEVLLRFPL